MGKHWFQKSTIVIALNRNKTHTTVQDSRAKTPIDLSVGTLYPSCQPSVKMPNRLSQPVKRLVCTVLTWMGPEWQGEEWSGMSLTQDLSIPVSLLSRVPPRHGYPDLCTLTSGHSCTDLMHAHIWARGSRATVSVRSIDSWVWGQHNHSDQADVTK